MAERFLMILCGLSIGVLCGIYVDDYRQRRREHKKDVSKMLQEIADVLGVEVQDLSIPEEERWMP